MPPTTGFSPSTPRTLEDVVAAVEVYSVDAFYFVQEGLQRACEQAHGAALRGKARPNTRHISGQQLCHALRGLALERWGLMTPAVLGVWGVRATSDFGRIVFAMIDAGQWQKTPADSLADFADVYDFKKAFVGGYAIALPERVG